MTTTVSPPQDRLSLRDVEALSPRVQTRRAVILLLVTLLLPGSAQLAAGNRRLGRLALRAWLSGLAAVVVALAVGLARPGLLTAVVTRPASLLLLGVVLVAAALGWAVLFADAWRLAGPVRDGRSFHGVTALAGLLVLSTSGTLLYGASMLGTQRELISGIFGSGTHSAAVDGRYNVLLLGGDAAEGRVGVRPDSITVASIDADTGATVLFALPRNLQEVPFPEGTAAAKALPEGFSCGDECLLNAVYGFGHENSHLFAGEDPGAVAMQQAAEGVTGLHINYYVLVELAGFRQLIDAMGGIDVEVGSRVPIGGGTDPIKGWIDEGSQHLDGYEALWFARSREGSSDYERMARQRCVMTAMVNQLDPQTLLGRFQQIAAATQDVVSTNLPDEDLATFVELGLAAKEQRIDSVQFVPPLIEPAYPDYDLIHATVRETLTPDGATDDARPPDPVEAPARQTQGRPEGETADGAAAAAQGEAEQAAAAAPVDARAVCRAG